jgi:hypothetical protein
MHDRSSALRPSFDYLNLLLTGCSFGYGPSEVWVDRRSRLGALLHSQRAEQSAERLPH